MLHVLLIEDSAADVTMIREALRGSPVPVDVVIAYDGVEGVRLLKDMKFDLVLLDLNVPRFSGHAILENHRIQKGPRIVVFSGSANPTDRTLALAFGADDYVVKPVTHEAFIKTVQGIIDRASSGAMVNA